MIKSKTLKIKARADVVCFFKVFSGESRQPVLCEVEGGLINRVQLLFNAQMLKYPFRFYGLPVLEIEKKICLNCKRPLAKNQQKPASYKAYH